MQCGTAHQKAKFRCRPKGPGHAANKSNTLCGITHIRQTNSTPLSTIRMLWDSEEEDDPPIPHCLYTCHQ